jgi:hypothetical protein|tara:strand:- start:1139 stop:1609 length:471 start_codon:yes stop_codon:yes gene_type:complete
MPDLLTHAATGYLLGRCYSTDHRLALLVAGSTLPDLLSRVPQIALQRFLDLPVGHFFAAFHTPAALVVACYGLSFLFDETRRRISFVLLLTGALFHVVLDLMQKQFYGGIYMPYFPFSMDTVQWPLFHIHASLLIAPVLLVFVIWLRRKDKKSANS